MRQPRRRLFLTLGLVGGLVAVAGGGAWLLWPTNSTEGKAPPMRWLPVMWFRRW